MKDLLVMKLKIANLLQQFFHEQAAHHAL